MLDLWLLRLRIRLHLLQLPCTLSLTASCLGCWILTRLGSTNKPTLASKWYGMGRMMILWMEA